MPTEKNILQAQINFLKERIGTLELHEKANIGDITDMYNKIKELEEYGNSVYEAIRIFSDDYTTRVCKGLCALENGVLSKLSKHGFIAKHIEEKWAKRNGSQSIFDKRNGCPEFDD